MCGRYAFSASAVQQLARAFRAEQVAAQKPTFRSALEKQRCLIPADAFYEWQDDTKPKQPWEFRLADGEPLVFAGLWHTGTLPSGDRVDAYCILTTQANDTLRRCHDRMPVILRQDDWEEWLSPDSSSPRLQAFFQPWPGPMHARPVTTKINKAAYDGPVEEGSLNRKAPAPARENELPLF
jgi:putative SOS response-associated peptidase YedK